MPFRPRYTGLIDRYRDRLDSRTQRSASAASSKASFQGLGITMSVTKAVEEGSRAIGCPPTGNPAG